MRAVAGLLCMLGVAAAKPPHVFFVLVDDLGWGDVGFHRDPPSHDVVTPNIDGLVREGIELDRHYVHMYCTPTRTSVQSGRLPVHVTTQLLNPEDPACGIPRNMTGIAEVMKKGGYATHLVGKWDAGMATPRHTPQGRGYDTSLGYFEHKNDFYTMQAMQTKCTGTFDLWDTDKPNPEMAKSGKYEEELFEERLRKIVTEHNPAQPLFLFYTPHVAHCPLQVPPAYMERFAALTNGTDETECSAQTPYVNPEGSKFSCRAQYHAMVNYLDGVLGNVTQLLRERGMWEDTLMVFSADNGGPLLLQESGSNNWPLRGSKYSPWEGGIRAAAFASGGFLPSTVQGSKQEGVIHIADWYATFAHLAGVDPTDKRAAESGLPPIDSINVWDLVRGANATSPRTEIPIDDNTLVEGEYKLILGQAKYATWGGPHFPNSTSHLSQPASYTRNCSEGCLYNVVSDPHETTDIAAGDEQRVAAMKARLAVLRESYWENSEKGVNACPPNATLPHGLCACWFAQHKYGGFLGPYQEVTP